MVDLIASDGKCNACENHSTGDFCEKCEAGFLPNVYTPEFTECLVPPRDIAKTVNNHIMWGVIGLDRSEVDMNDPMAEFLGDPEYDPQFDLTDTKAQEHLAGSCDFFLTQGIAQEAKDVTRCVIASFKSQRQLEDLTWPVPADEIYGALKEFSTVTMSEFFDDDVGYLDGKIIWVRHLLSATVKELADANTLYIAYQDWKSELNFLNSNAPSTCDRAFMASESWVRMFTELAAINGTVFGIAVSALCAFGSIFLFTMSLRITSLAILFMMMIIVIVLGTFNVIGWSIGVVEAITASIILGLSVDHIGHLSEAFIATGNHAFKAGYKPSRRSLGLGAQLEIGESLVNASISTILCAGALTLAVIQIFVKFGKIFVIVIAVSILVALGPYTAVLAVIGPIHVRRSCLNFLPPLAVVVIIACTIYYLFTNLDLASE